MQGLITISTPMDDFDTDGGITEVCFILPYGVYFTVVKPFCCYY